MINILDKYLKKLGVKNYEELNQEEKATFLSWQDSLREKPITKETIEEFITIEIQKAVSRMLEVNLSIEDMAFRKAELKVLQNLKNLIEAPKAEASRVKQHIEAML